MGRTPGPPRPPTARPPLCVVRIHPSMRGMRRIGQAVGPSSGRRCGYGRIRIACGFILNQRYETRQARDFARLPALSQNPLETFQGAREPTIRLSGAWNGSAKRRPSWAIWPRLWRRGHPDKRSERPATACVTGSPPSGRTGLGRRWQADLPPLRSACGWSMAGATTWSEESSARRRPRRPPQAESLPYSVSTRHKQRPTGATVIS